MRPPLLVALIVSAFSACGGTGTGTGIGDTARSLEPKIAQVRGAAEARQPDVVKVKLAELRSEIEALQRQGKLTEAGAARIVEALGGVEDNLRLITSTTNEPRPTTTLPRRATQPDHKDQDEKPEEEKEEEEEEKKKRD